MKKPLCSVLLIMSFVFGMAGCTKQELKDGDKKETNQIKETEEKMRTFTDSAGRNVEIPAEVVSVAPSGPLAQLVLYTAAPDKLAGIAGEFREATAKYINEKYTELPIFGQFYGRNANLNMEALIAEAPDLIVDIGEAKETVKQDMDQLQTQLNIPVVFIEASTNTMDQAYDKLGDLLGNKSGMKRLGTFCKTAIDTANTNTQKLKEEEKKGVYLALGENGLRTNAKGSFHAEVLDIVGAKNVAEVEVVSKGEGSEVSFEQVAVWNPEIIFTYRADVYESITADPMWAELDAVKNKKVYQVPIEPYNYLSDPPSVNRMIGIYWIGNLLYPEQYDFSEKDVKTFTKDFYHVELTDAQVEEILKNAR